MLVKKLQRRYLLILTPAVLAIALWALVRNAGPVGSITGLSRAIAGPVLFIGAVTMSLAAPLLYRGMFIKRVRGKKSVEPETFLGFETGLLALTLSSVYFAALAYILEVSLFHFSGAVLAGLYAAYYYYPSQRRIQHEMRIFRVKTPDRTTS